MAAVGKKKRKKVYVVRRRKGSILPLIIGGGVLAYFLFKSSAASSSVTTTTNLPPAGTSNSNPVIVDSGAGTGTDVIQPTPVTVAPGENMSAVNSVAASDRIVLLRDAAAYPQIVSSLKQMTSQEIVDSYNYFYNFFLPGKQLFRYPDPSHPGDWNTALYDAIQVIRSKYKIF